MVKIPTRACLEMDLKILAEVIKKAFTVCKTFLSEQSYFKTNSSVLSIGNSINHRLGIKQLRSILEE